MYKYRIPIVVPAYNRPESLERILKGLSAGIFCNKVELIISIDSSESHDVFAIADTFQWKHGEKKVIAHEKHLGLRNHILFCGDYALENDGVIVLEDDLFPSPYFYEYVQSAVDFYKKEDNVCGISLYNHSLYETAYLPFKAIEDGFDNYFLQIPSSWGQCWTKDQWFRFKKWYDKNQKDYKPPTTWLIPTDIYNWPESSWKKYFFFYMIDTKTYFTYPRTSLSSNFSDPGTHIVSKKQTFQVPLLFHKKNWRLSKLKESYSIYDSFCELNLDTLLKLSPEGLFNGEFEVDLYGTKPLDKIRTEFILSTKPCDNPIMTFGREMRPSEANIIAQIPGNEISFGKRESFRDKINRSFSIKEILFYYDMVEWLHFRAIINGLKINKEKSNPSHSESIDKTIILEKDTKARSIYNRIWDSLNIFSSLF